METVKIVHITMAELNAMMVKVVTDEMERAKKFLSKTTKQSDYLTKKEVATRLKISIGTLNNWIKDEKIPSHKIGRRVLFKESEIEESINQLKKN
ncbi:excisionase family DNA binding protein [Epilithonimonas hungarica]|uniref:helix-turn-helix domain-containing protein n=1 Tax=Epilithonimonas hungarica TaxID=454006 RepID=UPI0027880297|nr:helix-turn-helix domain-containing protein [Epilithonimonas hungarica]MDP9954794.1 excisionase family DNA binding protein [Epilithonimonas hungarica]